MFCLEREINGIKVRVHEEYEQPFNEEDEDILVYLTKKLPVLEIC